MKKAGFFIKQLIKMFSQAVLLPLCYNIYRHKETDKSLVIFADAHHHEMPYSMKLLSEKFIENGYNVAEMFSDYGHDGAFTTLKNMLSFEKLYAKAGYVVICDYFLPVSAARKKPETVVAQLWHACGIFKRFAYEAEDDIPSYYKGRVIKNYDLVTVSSPACVPVYSRAMQLPDGIVRPLGVSRTDIYFDEDYIAKCKEKLYRLYPDARGKKLAVWAPTFRGNAALPYLEGKEDVLKLRGLLGEDWYLLIRLHPHFHDKEISCEIPTEELLPLTDLLISDYSTVIFEYSLFEKPLVLFAPDYDTYGSRRGFYIDYKTLPGRIVTNKDELAAAVKEEYKNFDREKMRRFKREYMSGCDGQATRRIYDTIMEESKKHIS